MLMLMAIQRFFILSVISCKSCSDTFVINFLHNDTGALGALEIATGPDYK